MDRGAILSINNISKHFGGVQALRGVSFDIGKGEILGLLGANGAGKSTLLKILGGIEKANGGHIVYEGNPLRADNPYAAQKQGLVSVYQELNVFLQMTAAENLFLGHEPLNQLGLIDRKRMTNDAKKVLSSFGLDIVPNTLLQNLSVAKRYLIEIVRAMSETPKVLMLDEPTAVLSNDQIRWLFTKVRELAAKGCSVIYVSHRLDEIVELCDRCVVLKDGVVSGVLDGNFDKEQIIKAMIGRDVEIEKEKRDLVANDIIFSCKNLSVKGKLNDISFDIRKGEILGIGGLVGAGRSELLRALFGVDPTDSGVISMNGNAIKNDHPDDAIKNNIVLISEDRKLESLFLLQPVVNNITSNTLRKWSKFGFIKRREEISAAAKASESVSLDKGRLFMPVNTLSGGNQQKAVIAKALTTGADLLLLDEPTRGVDVGTREDIYRIINDLTDKGKSILLVSSDWEELLALSDRLIVLSEGKITAELSGSGISEESLMRYCTIANVTNESAKTKKRKLPAAILDTFLYSGNNTAFFGVVLFLLIIAGAFAFPRFLTYPNMRNILNQSFVYILLTLGQIFVIIHGYADLSMSAVLTVAGVLGLTIMKSGEGMLIPGVIAMLGVGVLAGTVSATTVVIGRMNSMIATYAISMMLRGIALIITPRPIAPSPDIFKLIVSKTLLGLPLILYIGAVFIIIIGVILKYTVLGRHIFAAGENPTAALWSGLRVKSSKFFSFIACSVMAVMGSFYMLGRSGAADATVAFQLNLDAIAFALIGGGTFMGGKASVGGSVLAVLSVTVLMNILGGLSVNTHQRDVIRGVLLVTIIILNELKASRTKA